MLYMLGNEQSYTAVSAGRYLAACHEETRHLTEENAIAPFQGASV